MSQNENDCQAVASVGNVFKFSSPSPSAYNVEGKLEIFEKDKLVWVRWDLPLPYVIRDYPHQDQAIREDRTGFAITLFEQGEVIKTIRSRSRRSHWNTGESWSGGGWSAALAVWNDYGTSSQNPGWVVHIRTPKTPSGP